MYFSNFPSIVYDATGNFDFKVVTNLLRRVALRQKVSADVLVFDYYDVKDGETPEIIAHKLYGDSELHWVILLINNITDRYHQWPKSYTQWLSFLEEKYPTDPAASTPLIFQTHHFEISQTSGDTTKTIECNSTQPGATTVTNYDYEIDLNEQKRSINLLRNDYLGAFLEEFKSLL